MRLLIEFRNNQSMYVDSYVSVHVPRVGDIVELGEKRPRKDYIVTRVEWLRPNRDEDTQMIDITVKEE